MTTCLSYRKYCGLLMIVGLACGAHGLVALAQTAPTLPQQNFTMTVGQTIDVPLPTGMTFNVSNNTNPQVASVDTSNGVSVHALSTGSTNITVCTSFIGCGIAVVSVSGDTNASSTIGFVPASASVNIGQAQSVQISGPGPFFVVGTGSNGSVAHATVSGSVMTVSGISTGSTTVLVCNGSTTNALCGSISVSVAPGFSYSIPVSTRVSIPVVPAITPSVLVPTVVGLRAVTASSTPVVQPLVDSIFLRSLSLGSRGDDVMILQIILAREGYFTGPVTGYFGPLTKSAVQRYQVANLLPAVGSVGPLTRALLNEGV